MYAEDSFFTLSIPGQIGLIALSGLLMGLTLLACRLIRGPWALRLALGAGGFGAFVWLSPQIYYQYYHLLFDDLPWQWVIRRPDVSHLAGLLTFSTDHNLSAHSQGLLGWAMILTALWPHKKIRAS